MARKKSETGYGWSGKRTPLEKAALAGLLLASGVNAAKGVVMGKSLMADESLAANKWLGAYEKLSKISRITTPALTALWLGALGHGVYKRIKEKKRSLPSAVVRSYGRTLGQGAKGAGYSLLAALPSAYLIDKVLKHY